MTTNLSQFDQTMAMWRQIDFPLIGPPPAELPFVAHLAHMYENGRVIHKTFALPKHPDLTDFIQRGVLHPTFFFERFWSAKSVFAALPYALCDLNLLSPSIFRRVLPVELSGMLAAALVRGGAYTSVPMRARRAVEIAEQAAELILNNDLENPHVYVSHARWSSFFHDLAWDNTWLVIRPADMRIEVVLATDTD